MHLVPAPVYQRKLASLRAADEFGRRQARDRVTLHMAKEAGRVLVSPNYEDFLKEAGIFSRLGGAIQKGVGKLLPKAKARPISGRAAAQKSRAAAAAQPKPPLAPKTRAAAQQQYLQKNIQRAQDKGVQKAAPATTAGPQVAPGPAAAPATAPAAAPGRVAQGPAAAAQPQPRTGPGYQRMQIQQGPQGVQATPMGTGATAAPQYAPGTMARGPSMQTGQAGQRPYAFEAGARHGRQPAGTVAQGPAARGGPRQAGDATPVPGTGESAAQYAGQFDRALGAGGAVSVPVAQRSAAQAVGGVAPGPASRGAQAGVKTRTVDASAGVRRRKGKDIGKVEQRKAKAESKQQGQQKAKADEDAARAAAQEQGTVAAGGGKPTGQEPPEGPQAAPEKTPGILPFMWRNRVPLAVGGGLAGAYGVAKGVPWAARQLEQSSMTPMAHGGGWSPVGYGYGQNPFGAATGGYMGPGG